MTPGGGQFIFAEIEGVRNRSNMSHAQEVAWPGDIAWSASSHKLVAIYEITVWIWALACMVAAHDKAQARIDRIETPAPKRIGNPRAQANRSLSMVKGGKEVNSWRSCGSAQRSLRE